MDRWVGGGIVATAIVLYVWLIPSQIAVPRIEVGGGVGGIAASPLFFPRLMAVLLGMFGASLFLRARSRAQTLGDGEGFAFASDQATRVAFTAVVLGVYTALLETVGYLLLTPVTLIALCVFLGYRSWGTLLATAAGFTAVVYYGFRIGMKVLLPEGWID